VEGTNKVVIVGGGVAGLTAAHELKERGFAVVVYEREACCGGKARSFPVPQTRVTGFGKAHDIVGLPAEHGFRFFPGFYRHLTRTMRRIPCRGGRRAIDNLVTVHRGVFAQNDKPFFNFPTGSPRSAGDLMQAVRQLFDDPGLGLRVGEAAFAAMKLFNAMTMCDERREEQLDDITWWDYMAADDGSAAYRTVVVNGLTQNLVAMKARQSSTKSVVNILARLVNDLMTPDSTMDRVLNGPTSEVWIDPWVQYLRSESGGPAVEFQTREAVASFTFDPTESRIAGIKLQSGRTETGAFYVAAVPVEVMQDMLEATPEILEHSPSLKLLKELKVNWMSGLVYYLTKSDVTMSPGHIVYLNSKWALTSISQNQFWEKKINQYGKPAIKGVISTIISDWFAPGNHSGRTAQQSGNSAEVAEETFLEIRDHLMAIAGITLERENIAGSYLDPALIYHKSLLGLMTVDEFKTRTRQLSQAAAGLSEEMKRHIVENKEPLFINTVGSWANRPTERTGIPNLFLASDYVRTNTDLATMEGANEAGRRAVNAILDATRSHQRRCEIFKFDEPAVLAPFRAIDKYMFDLGLPHPSRFVDRLLGWYGRGPSLRGAR
jgi:uncharacterized protein with NAD-binding domain and iron-sulfur cluster